MAVHASDSSEQRKAEPLLLAEVSRRVGQELVPMSLALGEAARVDVDGVAADMSVFVEIFAHQGTLKPGQVQKVAKDALKLITVRRFYPEARLIVCFAEQRAAATVSGKSWLAESLRVWQVEVMVADLDEQMRAALRAAQERQFR